MVLISGPCVIESLDILEKTAEKILESIRDKDIDFYFKASCVKDNRTKIKNYTGVGMKDGIAMLLDIKKKYNVKITTDFHNENDIFRYGSYVDLIQIPAYLGQQTSLIDAASKLHTPIHIKKPQFLGPTEAEQPYRKLTDLGFKEQVFLTDRGTMFGYNQTIFDPRHIPLMKSTGVQVLADVTHPNKNYPENDEYGYFYSVILARSAMVSGADGIFVETHPDCNQAKCDSKTMISLDKFDDFISDIYSLFQYTNGE